MTDGPDRAPGRFAFRKHDSIGAAAAEEDSFLEPCFVDTGDLAALRDCGNSKRIVIGRTGAGKSALLRIVSERCDHVIELSPQGLSLNYIANNSVIRFFEEAGVNLTPFYMLLWKHVLVVELLRAKYQITTEDSARRTMTRLREVLYRKDHIKDQAVAYLETWGNRFWLTSEERVKQLTEKVESSLAGSLGASVAGVELSGKGAKSLTSEQKSEVVQRGRRAVSDVQIRELENIIYVLHDEIFSDAQEHYYLTIDTLDEEWADDRIRFRLIKALIDTVRSFRRVENVKIIVSLRQDLLDKILSSTTDPGFQEEKYEALYLYVTWTREQLQTVLERRLNHLIRRQYTTQPIPLSEILPHNVSGQPPVDYILERTFLRPRDAIQFLNECIACAEGRTQISAHTIKAAEEHYSKKRLQSLFYEWQVIYPNLDVVTRMFNGMPPRFPLSDLTKEFFEEKFQAAVAEAELRPNDPNTDQLNALYTPQGNFYSIRNLVVRSLHRVGFFGIKATPTTSVSWSADARSSLAAGELRPSAQVHIHPMFHRALDIRS